MATVHKMPSGKWRAQVRRVGHKPLSTVCSSKKEAELWARDIEVKIDRGAHIGTGQRLTVSELFAAYRGAVRSLGRSKLAALINIEKKLGRHRVGELRPITFLNFAGEREREGAGPATVMMDLSFLATALVHAGTLVGAEEAVSRANLALRSARATLRHAGRISKPAQRNRRPTEVELTTLLDHFRCNPRQVIPMADIVIICNIDGHAAGGDYQVRVGGPQ